jgi:ceramide glucosyltransferase
MTSYAWLAAAVPAGYQLVAIAACLKRLAFRQKLTGFAPAVSILKPIRGADSSFYEAIRSQAEIDYPGTFELVFGIRDHDDPAAAIIQRLQNEFPERQIRIVWTTTVAANGKVGSLIDLERAARYEHLVISDADIRVPPDYLTKVVAPLEDPGTGLVTCLYRAHGDSLAGLFEAIGIETDFAPSALVAPFVGVDEFAFGSTIVVRRADLEASGGLAPIGDYIADDYQIGRRIHALGRHCVLAETVVDTHLGAASIGEAWRHQVRWARTIRVSRTGGYIGLFVTFATLWALMLALAGQANAALALLAIRMIAAALAGMGVMRSQQSANYFYLVPLRDLAAVAIWIAGLLPGSVEWRGRRMRLTADGRISCAGNRRKRN